MTLSTDISAGRPGDIRQKGISRFWEISGKKWFWEAKSDFDIELTSVGEKKINVIKVIREITSLGLKEAKELADGAPSVIKETVAKDEAEEVKGKLEEAGATVTLK